MKILLKWLSKTLIYQICTSVFMNNYGDLKKRTDECAECDIMANYEHPDKWYSVKKCPKCGKDTKILRQLWN